MNCLLLEKSEITYGKLELKYMLLKYLDENKRIEYVFRIESNGFRNSSCSGYTDSSEVRALTDSSEEAHDFFNRIVQATVLPSELKYIAEDYVTGKYIVFM